MAEKQHATVGIIVAIASIVLVLAAFGFVIYQRRGETVYQEERPFSSGTNRFEFPLATPGVEHRVFLVTKFHYHDEYRYTLNARLIFPSGGVFEKEILNYEHDIDAGSSNTTNDQLLWNFLAEEGTYTLELALQEARGTVTIKQVKIVVKKL